MAIARTGNPVALFRLTDRAGATHPANVMSRQDDETTDRRNDEALSYARELIGDGTSSRDYDGALAMIGKRLNTAGENHDFLQRVYNHLLELKRLHIRHN